MAALHPFPRPRRLAAGLVAAATLVASACGGGDPLPAPGPEPGRPDGVRVQAVVPAALDGDLWVTREARVQVRGTAPAGAMVEVIRRDDGSLAASGRAGDDGVFAIEGVPVEGARAAFDLQARLAGRPPGPVTPLVVLHRVAPPEPFVVDDTPAATSALAVRVAGTTETDVTVVVRVDGGRVPVEVRKPGGESRFALDVPLDRDRVHALAVSAADLAGNRAGPIARTVAQDGTAPPPPSTPTRVVSGVRATLTGRAPESVMVEVDTPADGRLSLPVAQDGAFAVEVSLPAEGENVFEAVATDAAGNRSEPGRLVIVRDTVPPPAPEAAVEGGAAIGGTTYVASRTVTLAGRTEPGATVEASGPSLFGLATAGADGAFRVSVTLPWSFVVVAVDVEAVDAAGNRSEATTIHVVATSDGGERGAR